MNIHIIMQIAFQTSFLISQIGPFEHGDKHKGKCLGPNNRLIFILIKYKYLKITFARLKSIVLIDLKLTNKGDVRHNYFMDDNIMQNRIFIEISQHRRSYEIKNNTIYVHKTENF